MLFCSIAVTVFTALLVLGATPGGAAFPGANGKIAFDTDRDGNRQVYVMNANGSSQANLTINPGGALAAPTIPTAEYCVGGGSFHFNVELSGVPDSGSPDPDGVNVRFRIASDDFAFSGFDFERIDVNFRSPSGVIFVGPEVNSFESAKDRWQDGPISDFSVSSLGVGSWRIQGSVPNGSKPFVPGNKVFETIVRTSVAPEGGILSTPITSCTPVPTPTPTPTPTFTPSATPTHTPTPTSTATPTATPTPTPTSTPVGPFGSVDCDGDVDSVDSQKILRYLAGLPVQQQPGCTPIGQGSPFLAGDVDCDGDVDSVDALKILRYVAGLPVQQQLGCPPIG